MAKQKKALEKMDSSVAEMDGLRIPRKLPRGINGLPQEIVLVSQRSRLVEATAHVVAEKGYADASVADIIAYAGVSRTTFYQLFKDKEDCFLSCFEALSRSHLEVVEEAISHSGEYPDRLVAGLTAYMERIDTDQWFARAFIGEAESATPAIRQTFVCECSRVLGVLHKWFNEARADYGEVSEPSAATLELVNAGVSGFVVSSVRSGRKLAPHVSEIACFICAAFGMPNWVSRICNAERSGEKG